MNCKNCGAPIKDMWSVCPYCGTHFKPFGLDPDTVEALEIFSDGRQWYATVEHKQEINAYRDEKGRLHTVAGRPKNKVTFTEI